MKNFFNGVVYTTIGVDALIESGEINPEYLNLILGKHLNNEDDNEYAQDKRANQYAIDNQDGRVVSVYKHKNYKLYVITDGLHLPFTCSQRHTTILLADEY